MNYVSMTRIDGFIELEILLTGMIYENIFCAVWCFFSVTSEKYLRSEKSDINAEPEKLLQNIAECKSTRPISEVFAVWARH